MTDRNDCYKYTGKMIRPAGRDESMIHNNSSSEDIETLRLENAELKKMMLELKSTVTALIKKKDKTVEEKSAEEKPVEKKPTEKKAADK